MSILLEETLDLKGAAEYVGKINAKGCHPLTIQRWCSEGLKGCRLERAIVGGRVITSKEAIHRFIERVTEATDNAKPTAPMPRTFSQRQRANKRAALACEKAGL